MTSRRIAKKWLRQYAAERGQPKPESVIEDPIAQVALDMLEVFVDQDRDSEYAKVLNEQTILRVFKTYYVSLREIMKNGPVGPLLKTTASRREK